eukprot:1154529-Pelagomonas_calceolata.AAC.3
MRNPVRRCRKRKSLEHSWETPFEVQQMAFAPLLLSEHPLRAPSSPASHYAQPTIAPLTLSAE